jgi:hypothetical protein
MMVGSRYAISAEMSGLRPEQHAAGTDETSGKVRHPAHERQMLFGGILRRRVRCRRTVGRPGSAC